ncbi:hypothetical protein GGF46_005496 [Coemansia sp. RSA 552]|nr:hypothetical protein GGF46_005496 [Coemansia sp. RSA 552]
MNLLLTSVLCLLCARAFADHGPVIAGYASGWKNMAGVDEHRLSQFTHINLAYAEPLANGSFVLETSFKVSEFADKTHNAGAQALLALGGWSGSVYISDVLKNADTRGRLISGIADCLRENHLDGVDIDWVANECNHVDPQSDTSNLLQFLKELRGTLDKEFTDSKKLVVMGVGMTPFQGADGAPKDLSEYAELIDYISIFAYDANIIGDTTGPNAPLQGTKESLVAAVDRWVDAQFPASKITAGLSFGGRAATTKEDMSERSWDLYQPREENIPRGDNDDGLWANRCTEKPPHFSGVWSYGNLRRQGVLQSQEEAVTPWKRYWDSASLTPWLFNPESKTFISYDDPPSIAAKVHYVVERGLRGVTAYDITMDHDDELMGAIIRALGSATASSSHAEESTHSGESAEEEQPASSAPQASTTPADEAPSRPTSSRPPPENANDDMDEGPRTGDRCGERSRYQCMKKSGHSPRFAVCASGAWILQQCSAGTVCIQNDDYIYCDWPR